MNILRASTGARATSTAQFTHAISLSLHSTRSTAQENDLGDSPARDVPPSLTVGMESAVITTPRGKTERIEPENSEVVTAP